MIFVYLVTKEGTEPTRLHLAPSAWRDKVLDKLTQHGYAVQDLGEDNGADTRDAAELLRRDVLLELADPGE